MNPKPKSGKGLLDAVPSSEARKVVINACHGGYGLSHAAATEYARRKGFQLYWDADDISEKYFGPLTDETVDGYRGVIHYYTVPPEQYYALEADVKANDDNYKRLNESGWYWSDDDIERDDPDLVAVVEELGDRANGNHAKLRVVEIPADVAWEIDEYDGLERVAEVHRTWA